MNVDRLIEMALDFSDFGVEEYDPELHQALARDRLVVYIPSTTDKFWDVIEHGIKIDPRITKDRREQEWSFDQMGAADRARFMAGNAREAAGQDRYNDEDEGAIQGIVYVAELKILPAWKKKDPLAHQIMVQAGAIRLPLFNEHVRPQDIVSVVFPAESNGWDVPIKQFVRQAARGDYDETGIPGRAQSTKAKFGTPTKEGWQYLILRHIQHLLNYSSNYFGYLVGHDQAQLGLVVLREATKLGWAKMMFWTAKEFMEWIYTILLPMSEDTTKEDDIAQVISNTEREGSMRPFYSIAQKYRHDDAWKMRSGQMRPPP